MRLRRQRETPLSDQPRHPRQRWQRTTGGVQSEPAVRADRMATPPRCPYIYRNPCRTSGGNAECGGDPPRSGVSKEPLRSIRNHWKSPAQTEDRSHRPTRLPSQAANAPLRPPVTGRSASPNRPNNPGPGYNPRPMRRLPGLRCRKNRRMNPARRARICFWDICLRNRHPPGRRKNRNSAPSRGHIRHRRWPPHPSGNPGFPPGIRSIATEPPPDRTKLSGFPGN